MNNVGSVALRFWGCGSRATLWPQPSQIIRSASSLSRVATIWPTQRIISPQLRLPAAFPKRHLSSTSSVPFRPSAFLGRLKQYDLEEEEGLTFRDGGLNDEELQTVFLEGYPEPYVANRLLKVLHARRVDGTLDIPLDFELAQLEQDYPNIIQYGVDWLNKQYPIDLDAAVLARFQREEAPREQENPSFLMERGQRLGLFKPQEQAKFQNYSGPQSGSFYAQLGEKSDDVHGRSEIEKIRKANEAKAEEEERKLNEEIEKRMAEAQVKADAQAREKSQSLAERPEQGLEVSDSQIRPPNRYEKYVMMAHKRAQSELTLESPEVKNMTFAQRVIPSLLFVLAGCGALYLLTEYWSPPRRSERMFPDLSLSIATVGTIFAINVSIYLAWKIPGAWRLLNMYFIVTPAYPRMFSMVGNLFSHSSFTHLFWNMATLLIFAPSLHEDVGRANFLAIYLASGLIGSWISMSWWLARGILYTSHQGASGCTYGVVAAYLWLHKNTDMSFWIIPEPYRQWATAKGSSFLFALVGFELIMSARSKTADAVAHIVGMVTGSATLEYLKHFKSGR